MGFVMDQCLHAYGNKWMSVVVVLLVDMRVCGYVGVRLGLTEEEELSFELWEKLTPKVDWLQDIDKTLLGGSGC